MVLIFQYILFSFLIYGLIANGQGDLNKEESIKLNSQLKRILFRRQTCPDSNMCLSKWGYCGYDSQYCGDGCQSGPCQGHGRQNGRSGNNGDIINDDNFRCSFKDLDDGARGQRLDGLRQSGWKPQNSEEAAVFLAHVYHETDGLRTLTEQCAPGCGPNYAQSWCDIQGAADKLYYGRGWFQLSYPCNYNAAGKSLGLDLLNNPDLVGEQQDVAVKTALWYYQTNNMAGPAQQGDFAATTRIINGKAECDGGIEAANQRTRVETYKRIRQCFGLGEPSRNPTC